MSETAWNTVKASGAGAAFELFFGYPDEGALAGTIEQLVTDRVASRIAAQDKTLWGQEAEDESGKRLAWVSLSESSRPLVTEIATLQVELRERGLPRVVLCGMGGSSLAPEVICGAAGVELVVLDSSQPDFVRAALEDRLAETVVVVSSKSGGTVETDSQKRAFEKAFTDAGIDPAERMIVVTDPGSPMEKAAREAGYRVFLADPAVGGRYSALTAFGLVPSGLAGADIAGLLDEAEAIRPALEADSVDNPGLRLGGLLGVANLAGVDKLVLANAGAAYAGLGDWAEQLIAESTGKDGQGILPVVVDAPSSPNFAPSTPDEVLGTFGPHPASASPSTPRWAPSCCGGSTPPLWPGRSSGSTRSTSPTWRAPRTPRARCSTGAAPRPPRCSSTDRSRSTPPTAGCPTAPTPWTTRSPRCSTYSTRRGGTSRCRPTSTGTATPPSRRAATRSRSAPGVR